MQQAIITRQSPAPIGMPVTRRPKVHVPQPSIKLPPRGTTGPVQDVYKRQIITTLFKRDYIARSGKSIVPTEKGLHIYDAVKDMLVADVSLTGSWERCV